ncbi:hypothetical protein B0T26DRAFT_275742 [Lasiosphaeria miniovina]|uniref:Secreted protein n=1 Tax=Lasiosphaeria miniovina TaxID=1954250 RepID=A0AA40DZA0_9PEZI|nr:uncharacterized protein B0T26DRAFT_275742 [Lasiosphaeria miniovina]KAK0717018.1 hypothetical protein B0T26DRAFT_275742 [Lasiosphaeria miniovina]
MQFFFLCLLVTGAGGRETDRRKQGDNQLLPPPTSVPSRETSPCMQYTPRSRCGTVIITILPCRLLEGGGVGVTAVSLPTYIPTYLCIVLPFPGIFGMLSGEAQSARSRLVCLGKA